ncbi:MAG: prolyl oligopeptidase [Candidatus Marinamargulisbacteria bacterium]|jgi:prolyl oligopeptidase
MKKILTKAAGVEEEIFGQRVRDPFRWLEAGANAEVQTWVAAQNAQTQAYVDKLPGKARLRQDLETLFSLGGFSGPSRVKDRTFFSERIGMQNHAVLKMQTAGSDAIHTVLDPNTFSEDGTVALDWEHVSEDGQWIAFGKSKGGDERSQLFIQNVDSGEIVDQITDYNTRACDVAWLPDSSGFYYTRYPLKGDVPEGEEEYWRTVHFHQVGANSSDDPPIFKGTEKNHWPGVGLSRDGRYLLVSNATTFDEQDVFFQDLQTDRNLIPIVKGKKATYGIEISGTDMFILTNEEASKYRVMKGSVEQPLRGSWKELIPEMPGAVIESFSLSKDFMILDLMENACSKLSVYNKSGEALYDIPLPVKGTVSGLDTEPTDNVMTFMFESYFMPPTVFKFDLETQSLTLVKQLDVQKDLSDFTVEQVWYASKDGEKVSMFLVHKKDMALTGDNPVMLTGYGGFSVSEQPYFSKSLLPWLEEGGVYAVPNLRGGGEYGEDWHKAGMREKKQNVFDDFISAAEYLIETGVTSKEKMAIIGGSNGGLLVGAVLTQRPDLFKAVVCEVPLLDMIRYSQSLIAELWVPEYGNPKKEPDFNWLLDYSPYHNVSPDTDYPATFFRTGESDSRVEPMHARKMAALVQRSNTSDNPILFYQEPKAGHGAGKPLSKIVDEIVTVRSFIMDQLGMLPNAEPDRYHPAPRDEGEPPAKRRRLN